MREMSQEELDAVSGAGPTVCFPDPDVTWPWDTGSDTNKLPQA